MLSTNYLDALDKQATQCPLTPKSKWKMPQHFDNFPSLSVQVFGWRSLKMGWSTVISHLMHLPRLKFYQNYLVWDRCILVYRLYDDQSPYVTINDLWMTSTLDDIHSIPIELMSVLWIRRSRAHWMKSFAWFTKIFVHMIEKLSHDIVVLDCSKFLEGQLS